MDKFAPAVRMFAALVALWAVTPAVAAADAQVAPLSADLAKAKPIDILPPEIQPQFIVKDAVNVKADERKGGFAIIGHLPGSRAPSLRTV